MHPCPLSPKLVREVVTGILPRALWQLDRESCWPNMVLSQTGRSWFASEAERLALRKDMLPLNVGAEAEVEGLEEDGAIARGMERAEEETADAVFSTSLDGGISDELGEIDKSRRMVL